VSYHDDGSEYTRGIGAVASLDRGAQGGKKRSGGAASIPKVERANIGLPRAMAATQSTRRRSRSFATRGDIGVTTAVVPTRKGPVVIVPEKHVPPPVIGKNIPYPTTKYQTVKRKLGAAQSFDNPAHAPTPATGSARAVMMKMPVPVGAELSISVPVPDIPGILPGGTQPSAPPKKEGIPTALLIGGAIVAGIVLLKVMK